MDYAVLAPVRFGFGLSPRQKPPADPKEILTALSGPDVLGQRWPGITTQEALQVQDDFHARKKAAGEKPPKPGADKAFAAQKAKINDIQLDSLKIALARAVEDRTGMRERLMAFWRDHFTVQGKRRQDVALACSHAESAVRPYIATRFPEMLRAATLHPMMLLYLDQSTSFGPDSVLAKKRPDRKLGLNENLARELMELHTLGVNGSYTQDDVRQLAELLTGLRVRLGEGMDFEPKLAEPGAEHVLGRDWGGDPAKLSDVEAVLEALALHPDTARHLSQKLAVHFVGPEPDAALTGAMAEAYLGAKGALVPVYEVLLSHPAALGESFVKVRQPFDFLATGMRALGLDGQAVMAFDGAQMRRFGYWPLRDMGQKWLAPPGPNGWPEESAEWIAPQQLSARINWALRAPRGLTGAVPEPVPFAAATLGARLSDSVAQAVPRAETKAEGVALVLASAELNRR